MDNYGFTTFWIAMIPYIYVILFTALIVNAIWLKKEQSRLAKEQEKLEQVIKELQLKIDNK